MSGFDQQTSSPAYAAGTVTRFTTADGLQLENLRAVAFGDGALPENFVTIRAPVTPLTASYQITLPPAQPTAVGQALAYQGGSDYGWTAFMQRGFFDNYTTALPMKYWAYAAATSNVSPLNGSPGVVAGFDYTASFGGPLLLTNQTDPTENGLWNVNVAGPWARDATTMPDNTGSAYAAIVPIANFGADNANTIWFSTADGSGAVHFVQIPTQPFASFSAPRMTSAQRDALAAVDGMVIYNTTTSKFQGREAGAWVNLI